MKVGGRLGLCRPASRLQSRLKGGYGSPRAGDGAAAAGSWANNGEYRCAGKTMDGAEDRRVIDSRWKRPGTWGASRTQAAGLDRR